MNFADPAVVGGYGAWAAMGVGAAMLIVAWTAFRKQEIRRRRLNDCGLALIFAANLVLVLVNGGPRHSLDWFLAVISPIIIAAALWRLFHTHEAR